ncbi:MAG: Biopolymer transport protein ExbB [Candidatus Moanabacter tarae]|uniref:Biopolymer transport protein ExbB n=1 Tax=Candidatus Moanibacter tarae TaxID=2200854 RepID=A0A2Z4AI68_9BACT|nr:MAG: Biopolymer transport protein ExbB [Candidatus Moanabacter tarae]|tara:strand:- start:26159 stop:27547 length:1389 start_codon:yes stop_codon:yes gene_type:complete
MKKLIIFLIFSCALSSYGENYQRAASSAKKDLESALGRVESSRQAIVEAKIPISQERTRLIGEVIKLRRQVQESLRTRDNRTVDLQSVEKEITRREDEVTYLASLLGDYVQRFENQIHIGEVQLYEDTLNAAKHLQDDQTISERQKLIRQVNVVELGLERVGTLAGGDSFEGFALSPDGVREEGTYILMGPITFFASKESDSAGIVVIEHGSALPSVVEIDDIASGSIRELAANGSGTIPLDPTLGDARKVIDSKDTLLEHIQKGQIVGYFILGLAALCLLIAIYKWIEISGVRRARPQDLQEILSLLREGKRDEALDKAKGIKGPVGLLLTDGVEHSGDNKELLEEVLYERLIQTQPKLERMIPFIAVVAATAPLMGLLGTVTGMIKTFKLITVFGTGDARSLSSGISEALVTTEFGLCVAIPSLIIHALLLRRTKGVLASMEQTAVAFKNGLETDTEAEK